MMNLFDRVYLRHDNTLVRGQGQLKLIISDRPELESYAQDKVVQRDSGILGVYKTLGECDAFYGGRDTMWAVLRNSKSKVVIIADKKTVATLLIQYWMTIFAHPTLESMYPLYEITVNNENMHAIRPMEKRTNQYSADNADDFIEKLTNAEFTEVMMKCTPSEGLVELPLKELPFEYAMAAYLVDPMNAAIRRVLFPKVDKIVKSNIVAQLIGSRDELLYESHNYYLLEGEENEVPITDPIAYMTNHPSLSWVLDDVFQYGNEDAILEKFGLDRIDQYIRVVGRILYENDQMLVAIRYIKKQQYAELIEYDIGDHRGNYFGTHAYQKKINSLLVSYMYQLKRLGLTDKLEGYRIK